MENRSVISSKLALSARPKHCEYETWNALQNKKNSNFMNMKHLAVADLAARRWVVSCFVPKIENTKFGCKFFRRGFCSCDTGSILSELEVTSLIILEESPIIESWERRDSLSRPGTKIYVVNMDKRFHTKFIFHLILIYKRVYIRGIGIYLFFFP
jgi:hypothetical protein